MLDLIKAANSENDLPEEVHRSIALRAITGANRENNAETSLGSMYTQAALRQHRKEYLISHSQSQLEFGAHRKCLDILGVMQYPAPPPYIAV